MSKISPKKKEEPGRIMERLPVLPEYIPLPPDSPPRPLEQQAFRVMSAEQKNFSKIFDLDVKNAKRFLASGDIMWTCAEYYANRCRQNLPKIIFPDRFSNDMRKDFNESMMEKVQEMDRLWSAAKRREELRHKIDRYESQLKELKEERDKLRERRNVILAKGAPQNEAECLGFQIDFERNQAEIAEKLQKFKESRQKMEEERNFQYNAHGYVD